MLQIQTDQEAETEDPCQLTYMGISNILQLNTYQQINAHQYSVYFADHNAGGIRINSNLTTQIAQQLTIEICFSFTIIEFDSGVI